ncbi:acyl-CoA dehydrogenase [Williamsia sp. 1138]|uniref:acyl-CoA dehydrogenase family protein n=1 Tax=Williamsia sp. 1138 TaxID=1903117 RepID=UPI000A10F271|nr:acyl-CoA dehydrogenase family protein [Williamsia sp. 1138]OZG28859.1 acyl-CoA dehydrogenase [Williamsia sp. 1138]
MTSTTAPRGDDRKSLSAYRAALREFLESDTALDEWRGRHYPTVPAELQHHAQLMKLLYTGGWNRYGWPVSAGGLGGDERHRAVLYDELSAHGLPVPGQHLVMETLGPPTVRFAPEVARTLFPGFLGGTEWWGQGFSEPEAGSDLASLRCRATREGDDYIVNGQKLWTSYGATARRLVCLVRTGTTESRHRGLSMLLIDVDTPGLQTRPIALASGREELAEVFFDSVRVPASRLIGEHDQGWAVAMYLLQFERGMYAWLTSTVLLQRLNTLRNQLHDRGIRRDGSAVRLGNVYLDIVALRARSAQTVQRLAEGETIGPEASTDKILLGTAEQALYDAARDLLGPLIDIGTGPDLDTWRDEWWYSRAATILGGSAEVQRGIIADRVLKLP